MERFSSCALILLLLAQCALSMVIPEEKSKREAVESEEVEKVEGWWLLAFRRYSHLVYNFLSFINPDVHTLQITIIVGDDVAPEADKESENYVHFQPPGHIAHFGHHYGHHGHHGKFHFLANNDLICHILSKTRIGLLKKAPLRIH